MASVYLLHLSRPLAGSLNRHYLGWVKGAADKRIAQHANGTGSAFMAEAFRQGITFTVAGIWQGLTRTDERRLKTHKNLPRYCIICRPASARVVMPAQRVPKNRHAVSGADTGDDVDDFPY
jgi:predicted GIY-YIG superfamily endonuclease